MVATAIIELALMVYALWKYRASRLGQLAAATLFFLAMFQVAEYNICGGLGLHAATWSRIGFMVIAILPPLGLHMTMVIAKTDWRWLRWLAYASAAVWIWIFGFTEKMFANHACGGNYIIFHIKPHYGLWYVLYYYFWLFAGIILSLWFVRRAKPKQRESLLLLVLGYFIFIIPTALLNTLNSKTVEGLPSILCGFAVLFAIILGFGILPNELDGKRRTSKQP
jgi:hypothetical protein